MEAATPPRKRPAPCVGTVHLDPALEPVLRAENRHWKALFGPYVRRLVRAEAARGRRRG